MFFRTEGDENYSVCIIVDDGEGSKYSSYTYLSYDEDFNKVSGMCSTGDYVQLPAEALDGFYDPFPSVQKVWQKYEDGQPVKYNDDGGAYYIVSMENYRPSFDPDFLRTIQFSTSNRIKKLMDSNRIPAIRFMLNLYNFLKDIVMDMN